MPEQLPGADQLVYDPASGFWRVLGASPSLSQLVARDPHVQRAAEQLARAAEAEEAARAAWEEAISERAGAELRAAAGAQHLVDRLGGYLEVPADKAIRATLAELKAAEDAAFQRLRDAGMEVVDARKRHRQVVQAAVARILANGNGGY